MSVSQLSPLAGSSSWLRRHPILRFVGRRVALGLLTLVVVSVIVFLALNVLPGNVASAVLGKTANPTSIAQLNQRLGLDRSLVAQYFSWLGHLLHGDFGLSAAELAQGAPNPRVSGLISAPLINTVVLAGLATVLLVPLSLGLGVFLARRAGKPADVVAGGTTLVFTALPEFVLGALLITIFFSWLGVLPPTSLVAPGTSPLSQPRAIVKCCGFGSEE